MKSRIETSKVVWVAAIAALVVGFSAITTIENAWAVTTVTNDSFFDYGSSTPNNAKYWAHKENNDYPADGTLERAFYCQDQNSNTKAACSGGLIDGRVNFVRHTLQKLTTSATTKWQLSFQGTTPFGEVDTSNGASIHNGNFPLPAVPPSSQHYRLASQFIWFDANSGSPYPISKPTATSSSVVANVLSNMWFKDTMPTTNSIVVIDWGWASLKNTNGQWTRQSIPTGCTSTTPTGCGWDIAWYERIGTDGCRYHKSIMLDNNSAANTWRATSTIDIQPLIANVFATTYQFRDTVDGESTPGVCSSTIAGSSSYGTNYQIVDYEVGSEMFNTGAGSLVSAHSLSRLSYS